MTEQEELATCFVAPLFQDALLQNNVYTRQHITVQCHTRASKKQDGLFADDVWPGAVVMANYLVDHPEMCANKRVLELGAGASLPSLVAAKLDTEKVVISDYPDVEILGNISTLISANRIVNAVVVGHAWGSDTSSLLQPISPHHFDLIILSEVLWKDTKPQHSNLLLSVTQTLSPCGEVLLTLIHRSTALHTVDDDLAFFTLAATMGMEYEEVGCVRERGISDSMGSDVEVHIYRLYFG